MPKLWLRLSDETSAQSAKPRHRDAHQVEALRVQLVRLHDDVAELTVRPQPEGARSPDAEESQEVP